MKNDYRSFLIAYLGFGPAIGFATTCFVSIAYIVFTKEINVDGQKIFSSLGVGFALLCFSLLFGLLPALLNFLLMMPFIKRSRRRVLLGISPITGYLAMALFTVLSQVTVIERIWPTALIQGMLGIVPAVCCTLIAFRIQDERTAKSKVLMT
ncbi:hypothetical protein GYN07_26070 (plasmid) [Rhizobium leguminosarum bv. viciae 248]|uniref:hypothetical protein n=1 Tax=Rhizobium leguminosarum TaxID=384 RepID=UPI0003781351|nr:hypothetical protein [Rhizobium leguminosarum]QHW27803.1 hypothetical protein GYN07_26070 [Rhizobium leguminosarum bv. viciae 248]